MEGRATTTPTKVSYLEWLEPTPLIAEEVSILVDPSWKNTSYWQTGHLSHSSSGLWALSASARASIKKLYFWSAPQPPPWALLIAGSKWLPRMAETKSCVGTRPACTVE